MRASEWVRWMENNSASQQGRVEGEASGRLLKSSPALPILIFDEALRDKVVLKMASRLTPDVLVRDYLLPSSVGTYTCRYLGSQLAGRSTGIVQVQNSKLANMDLTQVLSSGP